MKKIVAILTALLFILSYIEFDATAQEGRLAEIKAEIRKHREAIKRLKEEACASIGATPSKAPGEEGDYGEDYGVKEAEEYSAPPPRKRAAKEMRKKKARKQRHKKALRHKKRGGSVPGIKKGPRKGKRKGRGPGLKAAPGKGGSKRRGRRIK